MVAIESINSSLINVEKLNIIDSDGKIIESIDSMSNLTRINEGSYVAVFTPLSGLFSLQLQGMDQAGYNFSHFFDTSVEVSSIFLTLSK